MCMHICMGCCPVTQSYVTLFNSMDCSTPSFPVFHHLPEFVQTHAHWISDAIQPSIFPSIRVFSNESALHIRWPVYWSFNFSISPFNEYSGLISFRINRFDLHAVQETLKSLLQHHSWKASILQCSAFLWVYMYMHMHVCMFKGRDPTLSLYNPQSQASQVAPVVKNPPTKAGDVRDLGSIPESGR